MQIIKKVSPNYTAGRKGRKPIAIVNHITAGLMPGCLSWMCNPAAKASAHYLVTRKGEVYQLVEDTNTSWHAGIVSKPNWPLYDGSNPNYYTIGIEHEGQPSKPLTDAQYQATLWLHRELIKKHSIPLDRDHIIGHYRIDSVNRPNCPGPHFPWQRLFNDLSGPVIQGSVKINIAGKALEGVIIEGRSYAPVRLLTEALGKPIKWDADTNTVIIPPVSVPIQPTSEIKIVTGSQIIPAIIIDSRSFAQVSVLCQALGHVANWENNMVVVR